MASVDDGGFATEQAFIFASQLLGVSFLGRRLIRDKNRRRQNGNGEQFQRQNSLERLAMTLQNEY